MIHVINVFFLKSFESSKSLNYPYILKRYIFFSSTINTKHDKLEYLYMYMYEPSSPLPKCPVKVASSQSGTTQVLGTCDLHRFNRKYPLSPKSDRVVRYVRTKLSTGRVVHRPNSYSATGKIESTQPSFPLHCNYGPSCPGINENHFPKLLRSIHQILTRF